MPGMIGEWTPVHTIRPVDDGRKTKEVLAALQSGEARRVAAGLRLAGNHWPVHRDQGVEMREALNGMTDEVRRQVVVELTGEVANLPAGVFAPDLWRWLRTERVELTPVELSRVAQSWEEVTKTGPAGTTPKQLAPALGRFVSAQFTRLARAPRDELRPVANILARQAHQAQREDPELLAEILLALQTVEPLAAAHVLRTLANGTSVSSRQVRAVMAVLQNEPGAVRLVAALAQAENSQPSRAWLETWEQVRQAWPSGTVRRACLAIIDVLDDLPPAQLRAARGYRPTLPPSDRALTRRLTAADTQDTGDPLSIALARGATWSLSAWPEAEIRSRLIGLIRAGARSGQGSPVAAHAAIIALERMDCPEAYAALREVYYQIQHKNLRKGIVSALERLGRKRGLSAGDMQDRFVDRHGLDSHGQRTWQLGRYTLVLSLLPDGRTEITARDGMGWPYPDLPAGARQYNSPVWSEIRTTTQAIQTTVTLEKRRLEAAMVTGRRWPVATWEAIFRDHPILANLASRLVWHWIGPDGQTMGTVLPDQAQGWLDAQGKPVIVPSTQDSGEFLAILHPINTSAEECAAWSHRFESLGVNQPFRQLAREIFRPEADELRLVDSSARYAQAILPQPQLAAIARGCGWSGLTVEGEAGWQGYRDFPEYQVRAWVALGCPGLRWDGRHVCIEQVYFHALVQERGRWRDAGRLALTDVPSIVFSETMRDLSLVVKAGSEA